MAGGPPVRGDLLHYWEADEHLSEPDRERWYQAARRIATGISELAHLPVEVDRDLCLIAFTRGPKVRLANNYIDAITYENIEARLVFAAGDVPGVALPCSPDASSEEIKHVVLAVVKAAHAVEFIILDDAIMAELQLVRAAEACVVSFTDAIKRTSSRFGSMFRKRDEAV